MNKKSTSPWLLLLIISVFFYSNVFAVPPQSITYQAYLKDSAGLPVNETAAITFRIYDAVTGGNLLWSAVLAVPVTNGIFSVDLGTPANPLPVAAMNNPLWLGVEIGVDGEAVPRKLFSSTINAFRAEDSNTIGGKTEAELQDRVSGICAAGQSIRAIAADGTVSCEPDDNTTYNGSNFAVSNQSCPAGQIVTGVNSGGSVTCTVDANSGGDITGVTAGSGLSGGGSSGSVTISHADTSSQASANNSSGYVIQDITLDAYGHLTGLVSTNLDSRYYTETEVNSNYVNVTGDSMTGGLSIGNNLEVGGQIYASKILYMNGNASPGDDGDQTIYFYNGGSQSGQSIKWNDFEARFDLSTHAKVNGNLQVDQSVYVTSDVDVTGSVKMGYQRVMGGTVAINTNVGNCTNLGTSNCYYDYATATCPAGTVVIGGGCNSNIPAATVIVDNYPQTTTSWNCNAYSSTNAGYLTPYAICARMGN